MHCSLPGSSIRGIFYARGLEWVASAFSHLRAQGMAKGSGLLNAWAQIPATSFLQIPLVKAVMGQTRLGGGKCLMFRSCNAQTVIRKRRHTEQN